MSFIKANFLSLIILVLLAVIYLQRCGHNTDIPVAKRDTTFSVQYIQQPAQIIPQYQPVIIESKQPVNIPQQYQPSADQAVLLKQYQDILNKFLSSNIYKDSIQLKDSAGNNVGTVKANDVVTENQIKSRDFTYKLSFPLTTRTITIDEPYKPRGQLFIGGGISGNQLSFVNAFEAGLLWKNKKDQIFGMKAGIGSGGVINYGLQSYWKIKLHK